MKMLDIPASPKGTSIPSDFFLEDNFKDIEKFAKKKEQQLKNFLVDESLSEIDATLYILKNGTTEQIETVVQRLPTMFNENNSSMDTILNYFSENLWKEKTEKQVAVGNNVVQILPCLSNQNKQVFFELLKLMLSLKKSDDVKEVWENVLVEGIAYFPLDILKTEIIKISYEKTGISQIDKSRVLGCKLFGRLAQRVEPEYIMSNFLDNTLLLCQDMSQQVRKTITEQIESIALRIGFDNAKEKLIQELIFLVSDEAKDVKMIALNCLINLLKQKFFTKSYKLAKLLPVFEQLLNKASSSTAAYLHYELVSRFGEYFSELYEVIETDSALEPFYYFFLDASRNIDPKIRRLCAQNCSEFIKGVGTKRYRNFGHKVVQILCDDRDEVTRTIIAEVFHQIVQTIQNSSEISHQDVLEFFEAIFLKLFQDTCVNVQHAIAPNLHILLRCFKSKQATTSSSSMKLQFYKYLQPILSYEEKVTKCYSWRRISTFLENFMFFHEFFDNDLITKIFLPKIRKQLLTGVVPVREMAAKVITSLIRNLKNYSEQVNQFKQIGEELCQFSTYGSTIVPPVPSKNTSVSFKNRIAYIDLCYHIFNQFSISFFSKNIADNLISLASDDVANVRIEFCEFLPQLALIIQPGNTLLTKIQNCCSLLKLDKDRDVLEAIERAVKLIEKKSIATSQTIESNYDRESANLRKELEEKEWIEAEKQQKTSSKSSSGTSSKSTSDLFSCPPTPTSNTSNSNGFMRPGVSDSSLNNFSKSTGLTISKDSIGASSKDGIISPGSNPISPNCAPNSDKLKTGTGKKKISSSSTSSCSEKIEPTSKRLVTPTGFGAKKPRISTASGNSTSSSSSVIKPKKKLT